MIVTTSLITKLLIQQIPNLDNITVMVEDFEPGKGMIYITTYMGSWSAYWGNMYTGHGIRDFFCKRETPYLIKKLAPEIEHTVPNTVDEALETVLKKRIIKMRRGRGITAYEASGLWSDSSYVTWNNKKELFYRVFGDDWWSNLPTITNPKYDYLTRVVNTIKEAFELNKG